MMRETEGQGGGGQGAAPAEVAPLVETLRGAGVPEELLGSPHLAKSKDLAGLVRSHVEQAEFLGRKGLPLPAKGPGEEPEAWKGVWKELGRPEGPNDYVIPKETVDGLPDLDGRWQAWLRETAHAVGMNQWQLGKFLDLYMPFAGSIQEEMTAVAEKAKREGDAAVAKEFGAAHADKLAQIKEMVREFSGGTELEGELDALGLTSHPGFMKFMAALAAPLQAERRIGKIGAVAPMSPAEAKKAIAEFQVNAEMTRALTTPADPKHAEARMRWQELHRAAFPSEA